jgi:hypothetical protein
MEKSASSELQVHVLIDRGDQVGTITLNLQDVFVQESEPSKPDRFEYSSATTMDYNVALAGFSDFSSGIGPREMSSIDVLAAIDRRRLRWHNGSASGSWNFRQAHGTGMADYLQRSQRPPTSMPVWPACDQVLMP